METTELPLFPLSAVLLPGGRMPLQVFEQRYLDLVRQCVRSSTPFGVVWIRRGQEVAQAGAASPDLGDYGTCGRITDWDQLPNGLLGVTVEGERRFDLHGTSVRANGLLVGQVSWRPQRPPAVAGDDWQSLVTMLRGLFQHPYVERMQLAIDYSDAWQVGYALLQLLPLEEALKYEMLGLDDCADLRDALDRLLNHISGTTATSGRSHRDR